MERIVSLNRGPFLARPSRCRSSTRRATPSCSTSRSIEEFAAGHVPGALNVPLTDSSFPTKAAFVVPAGARVALHAASEADADARRRGLRAVGILELAGRLRDPAAPERMGTIELEELDRLLAEDGVSVLDVREKDERDEDADPVLRQHLVEEPRVRIVPIRSGRGGIAEAAGKH